jgi:GNAT superfamily N-acetyltransferase
MVVRDGLDARRNPFYRKAERALFIAERGGVPVGRIAAIENRAHNRHHADRVGFFGFFDCAEDPEAAAVLLSRAEQWLEHRGLNVARGPVSPSMNHESGLLVAGFDTPPVIMTPWNPQYYGGLIEGGGYAKVQDLLGYDIPAEGSTTVPDRVRRLAERTVRKTGVTFRTLDVPTLEREARLVLDLYCDAWSGNWGFVPPSWDEFWHTAKDLKAVLVPEFSFVAEVKGEMVGFMMVARDINEVLHEVPSGRLWPSTIAKLLLRLPKVQRGRIVLLGLRAEYRNRGLFPLFAYEAARLAREVGYEGAEASWILDDNEGLLAPMDAMGMRAYKRWRIYEKAL